MPPTIIKYISAVMDSAEGCMLKFWRSKTAVIRLANPPKNISIPLPIKPEGTRIFLLNTEPNDHIMADNIRTSPPLRFPFAVPPRFNINIPAKPVIMPSHSILLGHFPKNPENRHIHKAPDDTAIADTPESTVCSATHNRTFDIRNSIVPISAAASHSFGAGCFSPRISASRYISIPAIIKRDEVIIKGGMVRTATRMARYVDDQVV